jgi:membrane protein DedA with SNARE-associated domain
MSRLLRFAIASLAAFLLSCIILGIAYVTGLMAGDHVYTVELPIKLSAPFAVLVGIIAATYPYREDSRKHNALLVAALGAVLGCLYWYLSGRLYALHFAGRWQWGFLLPNYELQAVLCWVAAGASALLGAIVRRIRTVLMTAAVLCSVAVLLPAPLFNYVTNNQELVVAFAAPAATGGKTAQPPHVITFGAKQFDAAKTAAQVLDELHSSGVQGGFCVTNLYRIGTGRKMSLQIIVLKAPVSNRVLLPEPNGTALIYVQEPNGWQRIPSHAPILHRSVEVWGPGTHTDSLAYFGIPDASGISLMGRVQAN